MSDYVFLFDLDSTLTKREILPTVAKEIGKDKEMLKLTEKTMMGSLPFKQSFLERVDLLKEVSVSSVNEIIRKIPLNDNLVQFISKNRDRCFIVTGNLDIWIEGLMSDLGMEKNYFSSKALVKNDRIEKIISIVDKDAVVSQLITPFVAIGDGNNDAEMIERADVGIGFGEVRDIAPSVQSCANYAIYKENVLCQFLERLL